MTPGMETATATATATAHKIPRPIMRYHGGKFRLADWIMEFFPDHDTYVVRLDALCPQRIRDGL